MRINYSDDEDYPGQFSIWQANCRRSLHGKKGQAALRDLEAALLALPDKRLIHGALEDEDGGVCAIAAYGKHKGVDLSKFDLDYASDEVGIAAGMPKLVAWKVVEINDVQLDGRYVYDATGKGTFVYWTPEERYQKVLAWVREELGAEARR